MSKRPVIRRAAAPLTVLVIVGIALASVYAVVVGLAPWWRGAELGHPGAAGRPVAGGSATGGSATGGA